jgi:hypothetical protein
MMMINMGLSESSSFLLFGMQLLGQQLEHPNVILASRTRKWRLGDGSIHAEVAESWSSSIKDASLSSTWLPILCGKECSRSTKSFIERV